MGLGWLDCDDCDDDQKEELGCHRFGNRMRGRKWTLIDYTGNPAHDRVRFCPRSCLDPEATPPGRVPPEVILKGCEKYRKVKACGGVAAYNGEAPADSPPRVGWFFATIDGVVERYKSEVRDTQQRLNAAAVSALTQRFRRGRTDGS